MAQLVEIIGVQHFGMKCKICEDIAKKKLSKKLSADERTNFKKALSNVDASMEFENIGDWLVKTELGKIVGLERLDFA